ncbi:FAD-binding domain-containing protein [Zopfia rhizophila CBS 207.26]|uniref:FAD-binding domain-containing protein n=1 Tax=Zopfia rhizophila CBS 207.26 TaxID=1314779 RepID=A0A6A6EL26_9PEZI|nr:FAD-binding domain-containing protein [Zopfia rhizophila CBS 207.26]
MLRASGFHMNRRIGYQDMNGERGSTNISSPKVKQLKKVAIKGCGHTAGAGVANVENGVTIDMKNFKGIAVDPETSVVSIGAGEKWGDAYGALAEQGLAVCGGRVSNVCVAGLTLGGLLSLPFKNSESFELMNSRWYIQPFRQMGFVCDNVVHFEIVFASGEVVQANAKEHLDLFIALKGGSNNFGIVTPLNFPTFKQGLMWGGSIYLPSCTWPEIVNKFYEFSSTTDPANMNGAIIAAALHSPQMAVTLLNPSSTDAAAIPSTLKAIANIQPQLHSTMRGDTLLNFCDEQAGFSHDGNRQLYFITTFKLSREFMLKANDLFTQMTTVTAKEIPGFVIALVFQPITIEHLQAPTSKGGNSLGICPEDGPLVNTLLTSLHTSKEDYGRLVAPAQGLLEQLNELAESIGVAHRYRFINYAYKGTGVIEGYGEESMKKLWAATGKYDPEGLFQKRVPGGFKLRDAEYIQSFEGLDQVS